MHQARCCRSEVLILMFGRITMSVVGMWALAAGLALAAEPDEGAYESGGLERFVPAPLSDGLEMHAWGWLGYLYSPQGDHRTYQDEQLAMDVTRSFGKRLAATVDMHFIDVNNHARGELEQAFVSALLSEQEGSILTVGKFNASFGVEPRDFWNRLTGTASLVFGAQPQDLIGGMLTLPVGDTGVKIRPFLAEGFEGHLDFGKAPSGGFVTEWRPMRELTLAMTNWVGPGWVQHEDASSYPVAYAEYDRKSKTYWEPDYYQGGGGEGAYQADAYTYGRPVVANWTGPYLNADPGGTMYFLDAKVVWTPRADWILAGEYLLARTWSSEGQFGWDGAMALANYDITDKWRIFGRWSYLHDPDGIVTGTAQRRHEASVGLGYTIYRDVEIRGEYRHDWSDVVDDSDSVSVHLSFGY